MFATLSTPISLLLVTPSEVEESRCGRIRLHYGILRLRSASLRMTENSIKEWIRRISFCCSSQQTQGVTASHPLPIDGRPDRRSLFLIANVSLIPISARFPVTTD